MPASRKQPLGNAGRDSDAVAAGRDSEAVAAGRDSDAVAAGRDSDAVAALRRADPVLRKVIDQVGDDGLDDFRADLPSNSYATLIRAIAGQQLSNAAAAAIYNRLLARYGGRPPTPAEILADDPEELRIAGGLSHAKVRYLRSLAEHVLDGSLDLDRLDDLPDEEVIAALVAVKGIGLWSAQMFLIIHLRRPDVLPVGDLGIRKAVMNLYGLPALPGPAELAAIGEPWRPYRTLASLYLWRSIYARPG